MLLDVVTGYLPEVVKLFVLGSGPIVVELYSKGRAVK